jgi:hypothetical protein
MSKQSSLNYKDDYSLHYEISIRNEYTRFAFMFYLFTLFALLTTIFLFIITNNSYNNESETIRRRFIPFFVLGLISVTLFFIFFLGSLVYTSKLIKKLRLKQTFINPSSTPPCLIDNSTRTIKLNPIKSFEMNTDESYYASTKAIAEQKSRTTNLTSHSQQTDV